MSESKKPQGVHRLVDMLVEEVSLVDRAANQHRFLIVKRSSETMAGENTTKREEHGDAGEGDTGRSTEGEAAMTDALDGAGDLGGAGAAAEGSLLAAAVEALAQLTTAVESLGQLGADASTRSLAALAQSMQAAAQQLVQAAGITPEPSNQPTGDASGGGDRGGARDAKLEDVLASVETTLAGLRTVIAQAGSAKADAKPAEGAASDRGHPAAPDPAESERLVAELRDSLTGLATSLGALTETVKEQQKRLLQVEKSFGLPNSIGAEAGGPRATDVVGWPLDLNAPAGKAGAA